MRVLDLFCGAGGASRGYAMPGVEIVGVDWVEQRQYPYTFIKADAMTFPLDGFDVIHASPPCQGYARMRWYEHDNTWMLRHTIDRLAETDAAWFVENTNDVPYWHGHTFMLCGASLGCITRDGSRLFLARHRKFWSNQSINAPECACRWYRKNGWVVAGVYGNSAGNGPGFKSIKSNTEQTNELMGIDWMVRRSIVEAVPPRYTRFIMHQWLNETNVANPVR